MPCEFCCGRCCRSISRSAVDTTLEDKTKELMEESRMLLVQLSIDKVSLGVHSMGKANLLQVSTMYFSLQQLLLQTSAKLQFSLEVMLTTRCHCKSYCWRFLYYKLQWHTIWK